jgi:hypothetical protein
MNTILPEPALAALFNLAGPDLLIIGLIVLLLLFLLPAFLQWLWNMTIPEVFGSRTITYWQAFRLILICGILFGGLSR